jgi:hypothetical protein
MHTQFFNLKTWMKQRAWRTYVWVTSLGYHPDICLDGLRKITKSLSQDSRSSSRDSNRIPHKYESRLLPLRQPLQSLTSPFVKQFYLHYYIIILYYCQLIFRIFYKKLAKKYKNGGGLSIVPPQKTDRFAWAAMLTTTVYCLFAHNMAPIVLQ